MKDRVLMVSDQYMVDFVDDERACVATALVRLYMLESEPLLLRQMSKGDARWDSRMEVSL